MHKTSIILFALAVGSTVTALDPAKIARRVPVSNNLMRRDNYTISGGWALLGATTCPTGTTGCGVYQQTRSNSCCPNALFCSLGDWIPDAMCCPDSTSCQSSLITTPACADPSWVLWQGQIGLVDRECVSGQQNVAASIEASLLGTGAPNPNPTETAVTVKTTATATKNGGSATATITAAPTTSTSGSGGLGSEIKSAFSHNDGNHVAVGAEVLVGAMLAALL
ncbi:hypothetical protein V8E51_015635 [Hyaloscypha variabilis]